MEKKSTKQIEQTELVKVDRIACYHNVGSLHL